MASTKHPCPAQQQESLMDVLAPPQNPWLRELERGKSGRLPAGIRIVRHVEGGQADEGSVNLGDRKEAGSQTAP